MSIMEKPLRYGERGRGFAMLTLPEQLDNAPLVVLLNAGLLHRAEPYRLNVLAGRKLARIGFLCVRVDLSGKGETPVREGMSNRDSVALDWKFLCQALDRQFGRRPTIVMGLCSGADNGMKLAAKDERIRGLVLLDARSSRDPLFLYRHLMLRARCWEQWARLPFTVVRRLKGRLLKDQATNEPDMDLRDLPRPEDLRSCLDNLMRNDGRILAVFTREELDFYNQAGQFARTAGVPGLERICTELFWPDVDHTYPVSAHRTRLLTTVEGWAKANLQHFRAGFEALRP